MQQILCIYLEQAMTVCSLPSRLASVGGYCNVPGECLCQSGYMGMNCEVGMKSDNNSSYYFSSYVATCM